MDWLWQSYEMEKFYIETSFSDVKNDVFFLNSTAHFDILK